MQRGRINDPKDDLVFKYVFGNDNEVSKKLLKILIEGSCNLKVKYLKIKNSQPLSKNKRQKNILLDVLVTDENGTFYDVEMQCYSEQDNEETRFEQYGDRIISGNIRKGRNYADTPKTYVIVFRDSRNPHRHQLIENYAMRTIDGIELQNHKLEVNFVYIKEIEEDLSDPFKRLVYCFNEPDKSDILGLKYQEVKLMKKRIEEFNDDEILAALAWKRKMDRATRESNLKKEKAKARADGRAEGRAEGKAEGIAEGKAEGIAEGKADGRRETQKEIALNLKKQGFSIEMISTTTGLSKEEIQVL